jgi:leader peptidase (prepilin peptidase) / N-methyltransferase
LIEAVLAGFFGLLIGSFLNVCIYRMPRDLSVVGPRSFCPWCEQQVAWYDNIPLLSWLLLRGKCRSCGAWIPLRYPAVELLTGVLFSAGVLLAGPTLAGVKFCLFAALMVGLIFMDFDERILADEFTLGGAVAGVILAWWVLLPPGFIALFLPYDSDRRWISVAESLSGGAGLAGMLWGIGELYRRVRKREGLGFGDVKMVACIGAFLGPGPALLTVILGSVLGSLAGIAYIWLSGKDASTYELPFGSFLGIAALALALAGLVA